MNALHRPGRAGFTLIEIMVVVTIIGMLVALGFGGYRMAQIKASTNQTETRIKAIEARLETYRSEYGEYPEPANEEETAEIDGKKFPVGAARMLYQVMSGDGNDQIKNAGEDPSTGTPGSTNKPLWDEVVPPTEQEKRDGKRKPLVDVTGESGYYLIDGFRKPLQYQRAKRDRNKRIINEDEMYSTSDIEIWSFGTREDADDTEEAQRDWIKSWDIR